MYKTEQKKELIEYMIENSNIYVSAEEKEKYFKNKKINVGLTTIYRFLKSLEDEEKVRIELKNHTKYYQYILEECDNHYHLKCTKCGKVIHFHCKELEELNSHISKEHKFQVDTKAVIYGICDKCM